MRILFATTVLPGGRRSGGEVVSHALVSALRDGGHDVDVLGYARPGDEPRAGEVCAGWRPIESSSARVRPLVWGAAAILRGDPYSSAKYRSGVYRRLARQLAREADVVIVDHAQALAAVGDVEPTKPIVTVAHNAEARLYGELARTSRGLSRLINAREARQVGQLERTLAERSRQVWTLTSADADYVRSLDARPRVRVLEVSSAVSASALEPEYDVALLGSWSWRANAQGLEWFCDRVLPRLEQGLSVHVGGGGAEWLRARHADVTVRGVVADAGAFLARARVIAVPAVAGGGLQVKTLDAIASGAPVVATTAAVRGIDDLPESVCVADDPTSFARALHRFARAVDRDALRAAALTWTRERSRRFQASVEHWIGELDRAALSWSA